jgi:hypothetical protein
MKTIPAFLVVAAAACGGGTTKTVDAPNVPATINISGVASERSLSGTTPVAGAVVAAYSNSAPSTVVVMTMTDTAGMYTLAIPTMGKPVDGFVKATKTGYMDTYLYAPAPLTADFASASINMLTPSNFGLLSGTLCAANQSATMGTVAVEVVDTANATVGGATVSSSPAASKACYDQGGIPNKSATMTDTDGVALLFNVTGSVSLSATKSGATFKMHTVNAVAGAFTTTLITE